MTGPRTPEHVELSPDEREPFGRAPADDALVRQETVLLTRPAALPGVELWTVWHSARLWTVHHEAHAFCVIDHYEKGSQQAWWYRRRDYSASLRSVMLLEPGELHVTKAVPPCDFRVLIVQPWLVARLLGQTASAGGIHLRSGQSDDASLARLFRSLCGMVERASVEPVSTGQDMRDRSGSVDLLSFEQKLVSFFARTLRTVGEGPYPAPRYCRRSVKLARRFVLEHFQERVSLQQLASLGAQSPWHFARSFRAEIGVPPAQYVRRVRVGKALEYLRSGFRPHRVASMAGFSDHAQMTRAFRQMLGFARRRISVPAESTHKG